MGKRFKSVVNKYLLSEVYSRWNRGGFLVGDTVHLKSGFQADEHFKELPAPVIQEFLEFAKEYEGNNLRIVGMRTHQATPLQIVADENPITMVDVQFDIGGPLHGGPFQVPTSILELDENVAEGKFPKIPDKFYYDTKVTPKPEEVNKEYKNEGIVTPEIPEMKQEVAGQKKKTKKKSDKE